MIEKTTFNAAATAAAAAAAAAAACGRTHTVTSFLFMILQSGK